MWQLIGSAMSSLMGSRDQRKVNSANSAQALRQMEFEERLSKTAHQREVKDLKKAGLNPMLSGTGGGGASTPSGAQAKMENPSSSGAKVATSAAQLSQMQAQTDKIQAETTLLKLQEPEGQASAEVYDSLLGVGLKGKQILGKFGNSVNKTFSAKTVGGKKYPWWKGPNTPMVKNAKNAKNAKNKQKQWTNQRLQKVMERHQQ